MERMDVDMRARGLSRRMNLRLVCIALGALALAASPAYAETRWAASPADGTRWSDASGGATVHLVAGDEVEVLATQGALVRVRKGTDFGWVAGTALTTTAPATPNPAPPDSVPGTPAAPSSP